MDKGKIFFFGPPHRENTQFFLALLLTDMEQFKSSILELIKFQIQSQKELQEKFQQQILELKENNDKKKKKKTTRNFRADP